MFSYIYMKILESAPQRYDAGINLGSFGHAGEVIDTLVSGYVEQGMDVLDIGCGTGTLAVEAAKKGARVVGIDISDQMLSVAREKVDREGLQDRIELKNIGVLEMDEELEDNSFDCVVSTLAFSELSRDERLFTLRQCHRVLRDDGCLVIADETVPRDKAKRILYRALRLPMAIITFLVAQTGTKAVPDLEGAVEQSGFEVSETKRSFLDSFTVLAARKSGTPQPRGEREPTPVKEKKNVFAPVIEYLFRWFPCPVETGLRVIGNPDRNSPVLVTGNYSLTEKRLKKGLGNLDCYLLLANTKGINPWCAAGEGTFNAHAVASVVKSSGMSEFVDHKTLVLPQLGAPGLSRKEVSGLTGWKARFGPVYADDIPEYIRNDYQKTDEMRIYDFKPSIRLDLGVSMNFQYYLLSLIPIFIYRRKKVGQFTLLFWALAMTIYMLFDRIPTRFGWSKALLSGFVFGSAATVIRQLVPGSDKRSWDYFTYSMLMSLFLGMDLAGSTGILRDEPLMLANKLGIKSVGPFTIHDLGFVQIDREKCIGCGNCLDVCPRGVFVIDESEKKATMANPDACEMCKACLRQCAQDALLFELAGKELRFGQASAR